MRSSPRTTASCGPGRASAPAGPAGSGAAVKVDGGYRITARKVFGSGAPAGDLLMTMAVYEHPQDGPVVLHVAVPLNAPGVTVQDTWRTLGMRGTGSHDIVLDDVFGPSDP